MKKSHKTMLMLGILILGAVFISGNLKIETFAVGSGECLDLLARPVYGWLSCEPSSGSKFSSWVDVPKNGKWYTCSDFATTDECRIDLRVPGTDWLSDADRVRWQVCDLTTIGTVNENSCDTEQTRKLNSFTGRDEIISEVLTLPTNKGMFIIYEDSSIFSGWQPQSDLEIRAIFKPFVLWRTDVLQGGKKQEEGIVDCSIPSEWYYKQVIDSTESLTTNTKDFLYPYETSNYISSFIFAPSDINVEQFSGQRAACVARQMYTVEKTDTKNLCYEYVNLNKPIIGGAVSCCDGEATMTHICRDHEFVRIEDADCSWSKPCKNTDWERYGDDSTGKTVIQFKCIDGTCVPQTKEVECTYDTMCPDGYVCRDWQCTEYGSGQQPPGPTIPGELPKWFMPLIVLLAIAFVSIPLLTYLKLRGKKR